tara:strand:- start:204 stop:542 length:339 start_codon:yes stop_codon:yes gene_type:complete
MIRLFLLTFVALFLFTNVKAGPITAAGSTTTAHIITENVKGTDIDNSAVINAETQKLIHRMSIDILNVVFATMPDILDNISAQLRQEADLRYKCTMQNDWITYANKECEKFK